MVHGTRTESCNLRERIVFGEEKNGESWNGYVQGIVSGYARHPISGAAINVDSGVVSKHVTSSNPLPLTTQYSIICSGMKVS